MAISPARVAAFDILLRVEREAAYASELLHSSQYEKLAAADHRLATELVMGVLRWRSWLDERIRSHSAQPLAKLDLEVLIALRLAAYQLAFLSRVPARAAVHESAELVKRARKRSAVGFVNAVLRKMTGAAATETDAVLAHPGWLVQRWQAEYGLEATGKICAYDQRVPATAVRLDSADEEELTRDGIRLAPGKLVKSARLVAEGDITKTRAFRECRVSIQDEGSQLVALLCGRARRILDCCAAPGGKTRVLAERNPKAEIVAVELHPYRARVLMQRVPERVRVVTGDVRELRGEDPFDLALADVPCTGTGTLARHPEIKWRLTREDIAELPRRQLELLRAAMRQVVPGGRVVYSTCSLEPEENAAVVRRALEEDGGFRLLEIGQALERLQAEGELSWPDVNSLVSGPYLRTIPGVHPCDGFFAVIMEKS